MNYSAEDILQWTERDVSSWLNQIGVPECIDDFRSLQISGHRLLNLTYDDIKDLKPLKNNTKKKKIMKKALQSLPTNKGKKSLPGMRPPIQKPQMAPPPVPSSAPPPLPSGAPPLPPRPAGGLGEEPQEIYEAFEEEDPGYPPAPHHYPEAHNQSPSPIPDVDSEDSFDDDYEEHLRNMTTQNYNSGGANKFSNLTAKFKAFGIGQANPNTTEFGDYGEDIYDIPPDEVPPPPPGPPEDEMDEPNDIYDLPPDSQVPEAGWSQPVDPRDIEFMPQPYIEARGHSRTPDQGNVDEIYELEDPPDPPVDGIQEDIYDIPDDENFNSPPNMPSRIQPPANQFSKPSLRPPLPASPRSTSPTHGTAQKDEIPDYLRERLEKARKSVGGSAPSFTPKSNDPPRLPPKSFDSDAPNLPGLVGPPPLPSKSFEEVDRPPLPSKGFEEISRPPLPSKGFEENGRPHLPSKDEPSSFSHSSSNLPPKLPSKDDSPLPPRSSLAVPGLPPKPSSPVTQRKANSAFHSGLPPKPVQNSPRISHKPPNSPKLPTKPQDSPKLPAKPQDSPKLPTKPQDSPKLPTKPQDSPKLPTKPQDSAKPPQKPQLQQKPAIVSHKATAPSDKLNISLKSSQPPKAPNKEEGNDPPWKNVSLKSVNSSSPSTTKKSIKDRPPTPDSVSSEAGSVSSPEPADEDAKKLKRRSSQKMTSLMSRFEQEAPKPTPKPKPAPKKWPPGNDTSPPPVTSPQETSLPPKPWETKKDTTKKPHPWMKPSPPGSPSSKRKPQLPNKPASPKQVSNVPRESTKELPAKPPSNISERTNQLFGGSQESHNSKPKPAPRLASPPPSLPQKPSLGGPSIPRLPPKPANEQAESHPFPPRPSRNEKPPPVARDNRTVDSQPPTLPPMPKQLKPPILPAKSIADTIESQSWYHGNIDRKECQKKLERIGEDGCFLIRDASKGAEGYSLSLWYGGAVRHLRIQRREDQQYVVGERKDNELAFSNIMELVSHHEKEPLVLKSGGQTLLAKVCHK